MEGASYFLNTHHFGSILTWSWAVSM